MNKHYLYMTFFAIMPLYINSMEISNNECFFDQLPQEIVIYIEKKTIALYEKNQLWEKINQHYKLKTVCKAWENVIPTIEDLVGIKPLHMAAAKGDKNLMLDIMLKCHNPLQPDEYGFYPIHYALSFKQNKCIKLLKACQAHLSCKEQVDKLNFNNTVVINNSKELLAYFEKTNYKFDKAVDAFFDKDGKYNTILFHTCLDCIPNIKLNSLESKKLKVINLLKCCASSYMETIFFVQACLLSEKAGLMQDQIIVYFKKNGGSLNAWGDNIFQPLHILCLCKKHNICLKNLLSDSDYTKKCPIDLNAKDGRGQTTLQLASMTGNYDTLLLLLENGVDINVCGNGKTPLHYAVKDCRLDIVTTLLSHGIDCNKNDADGKTALQIAQNCLAKKTKDGISVLNYNQRETYEKIIKLLLK